MRTLRFKWLKYQIGMELTSPLRINKSKLRKKKLENLRKLNYIEPVKNIKWRLKYYRRSWNFIKRKNRIIGRQKIVRWEQSLNCYWG
jgi:hypothetical protein